MNLYNKTFTNYLTYTLSYYTANSLYTYICAFLAYMLIYFISVLY